MITASAVQHCKSQVSVEDTLHHLRKYECFFLAGCHNREGLLAEKERVLM